jgi:fructoselysine 6-kinase
MLAVSTAQTVFRAPVGGNIVARIAVQFAVWTGADGPALFVEGRVLMDVISIGDNVSDWYLTIGQVFPGGNAVNVAVAVARSGGSCAYVGVVGDDAGGRLLVDSLAAERVDTRRLSVAPGPTACCQVTHADGERLFRPLQRGVALFRPTEDDLAFAGTASFIHSTYRSGMEDALPELARRGRVSFDFSDHVDDGYADDLLPFVHVAEFSAAALDDRDCADLVRWAAARGPAYVVVTRGSKGAMLFDGAVSVSVSAASSVVIDSLGAGDSFIGRALYGLIHGEPTQGLLAASARAAARTCSTWGAYGHGMDASNFAATA